MPKYRLGVTAVITCYKQYEIDADSPDEAEEKLAEKIDQELYNPIDWHPETMYGYDSRDEFLRPEVIESEELK